MCKIFSVTIKQTASKTNSKEKKQVNTKFKHTKQNIIQNLPLQSDKKRKKKRRKKKINVHAKIYLILLGFHTAKSGKTLTLKNTSQ